MIKLNYKNYLKNPDFNIEEEYKKLFTSSFQITTKSKNKKQIIIRSQFKVNNKNIFDNKKINHYKKFLLNLKGKK